MVPVGLYPGNVATVKVVLCHRDETVSVIIKYQLDAFEGWIDGAQMVGKGEDTSRCYGI